MTVCTLHFSLINSLVLFAFPESQTPPLRTKKSSIIISQYMYMYKYFRPRITNYKIFQDLWNIDPDP